MGRERGRAKGRFEAGDMVQVRAACCVLYAACCKLYAASRTSHSCRGLHLARCPLYVVRCAAGLGRPERCTEQRRGARVGVGRQALLCAGEAVGFAEEEALPTLLHELHTTQADMRAQRHKADRRIAYARAPTEGHTHTNTDKHAHKHAQTQKSTRAHTTHRTHACTHAQRGTRDATSSSGRDVTSQVRMSAGTSSGTKYARRRCR